jgi:hypothetical protein
MVADTDSRLSLVQYFEGRLAIRSASSCFWFYSKSGSEISVLPFRTRPSRPSEKLHILEQHYGPPQGNRLERLCCYLLIDLMF